MAGDEGADPDQGDPAAELIADLLRSYGPADRAVAAAALPLAAAPLAAALEELADAQRIIVDTLIAGAEDVQVCLADTLERLLRAARAQGRPSFTPLPLDRLPPFLAAWQGVTGASAGTSTGASAGTSGGTGAGASGGDLEAVLERLFGWPAPAELWEAEVLPARLDPYYTAWLDALFAETGLAWIGCGDQRLTFVLPGERDLIGVPESEAAAVETADAPVPPGPGRFTFEELVARAGAPSATLARELWRLAWRGTVTNDSFAAVRQGIASGFKPHPDGASRSGPGGGDSRLSTLDRLVGQVPRGAGSRRTGF